MLLRKKGTAITNSLTYAKTALGDDAVLIYDSTIEIDPKKQADYGDKNNCTITSISSLIEYATEKSIDFGEIYKHVYQIAKERFIYHRIYGTIIVFTNQLFQLINTHWSLKLRVKFSYLKDIGYTFSTIQQNIKNQQPMILSVFSANGGYYYNHSVIIRGILVYENKNKKQCKLLIVNDNWSVNKRYIDYDTISTVSAINCFI